MNERYKLKTGTALVFMVCLFCTHLWAGLNINAGPMLSKLDIDDYYGYMGPPPKSLPGFRAGISYSIGILKNSYLEPGLFFTNEACQFYYARGYNDLRVNFLKLNVLLNVCLVPTRFHFIAGPYAALRLGEENDHTNMDDVFKAENKTGWGVQMGFRFYFKKSKGNPSGLFAELLGDMGLTKFQNEVGVFQTTYYQSKHISLMIGYTF